MRLLILSDSHGSVQRLQRILEKEPQADVIFHLGDGAPELLRFTALTEGKRCFPNKGNCDCSAHRLPPETLVRLGNETVYACHGHLRSVKSGLTALMYAAMEKEATICLYGHTHIPSIDFRNGILFLNPGAVQEGRYATVDLSEDKQPYPSLHSLY